MMQTRDASAVRLWARVGAGFIAVCGTFAVVGGVFFTLRDRDMSVDHALTFAGLAYMTWLFGYVAVRGRTSARE